MLSPDGPVLGNTEANLEGKSLADCFYPKVNREGRDIKDIRQEGSQPKALECDLLSNLLRSIRTRIRFLLEINLSSATAPDVVLSDLPQAKADQRKVLAFP